MPFTRFDRGLAAGAILLAATLLGACQPSGAGPAIPAPGPTAQAPFDATRFDAFIETRPTPAAFRAEYPEILLVLPGDMTTMEMRFDHSRYFADLDAQGRIIGGDFH